MFVSVCSVLPDGHTHGFADELELCGRLAQNKIGLTSSASVKINHNHHFDHSVTGMHYLSVSFAPTVWHSLIEKETWDL